MRVLRGLPLRIRVVVLAFRALSPKTETLRMLDVRPETFEGFEGFWVWGLGFGVWGLGAELAAGQGSFPADNTLC